MGEFINQHWVAYLLALFYALGVFAYWQSSFFSKQDWWLAFVVPVTWPVYALKRWLWGSV